MPPLTDADTDKVNRALAEWRQGDLILKSNLTFMIYALPTLPLTPAAQEMSTEPGDSLLLVETDEAGYVVVSQTCDVVRDCRSRPFVEISPLVPATVELIEETRRLRRSNLGFHSIAADHGLVVDLERTMTLEKPLLVSLPRTPGIIETNASVRFAAALANRRFRFAFPDDLVDACQRLIKRIKDRSSKQSEEGQHVDALDEIRVTADPDWDSVNVDLSFWLIKRGDPPTPNWPYWASQWGALVNSTGRYSVVAMSVTTLDDMTARDYQLSHHLDLDQLSAPAVR